MILHPKRPTLLSTQERSDILCALRASVNRWPPEAAARALRFHDRLLEEIGLGSNDAGNLKAA